MALTASAPPAIQETISKSLHLKDPAYVLQGLDRPNIFLSASPIKALNVSFIFYHCEIA
jgi:superfamily II DNA helicase RecQ